MFEKFFRMPTAVQRHRNAPLAQERAKFLDHMTAQGYPRVTLMGRAEELLFVTRILNPRPGITQEQIKAAAFKRAQPLPGKRRGQHERFITVAKQWLGFLGWLKPAVEPLVQYPLIERYEAWMRDERGLSPKTIWHVCWRAKEFLRWLEARHRKLEELTLRDVDSYLEWLGERMCRRSISVHAAGLRSFLKYGGMMRWCSPSLWSEVHGPRIYKQETLPSGPAWSDVIRLLRGMDTDDPCDVRDRAILMLLSIYGLRAGEVAVLRLDDIDWDHGQIFIRRPKVQRAQVYPLVPSVGQAILRYLREVRPRNEYRELFLTLTAPFKPVTRFYRCVRKRFGEFYIHSLRRGTHSLRHACAGHLLDEGFSIKEIADHLGHRSLDSTQIYAKIDLKGLGEVAAFDLGGLV